MGYAHSRSRVRQTARWGACRSLKKFPGLNPQCQGPLPGGKQQSQTQVVCWLQETWDILCLLLMIRINYHHQLIMNKRRIPCLDDYLDRINLTLWPRFKVRSSASWRPCCHIVLLHSVSHAISQASMKPPSLPTKPATSQLIRSTQVSCPAPPQSRSSPKQALHCVSNHGPLSPDQV